MVVCCCLCGLVFLLAVLATDGLLRRGGLESWYVFCPAKSFSCTSETTRLISALYSFALTAVRVSGVSGFPAPHSCVESSSLCATCEREQHSQAVLVYPGRV